MKKILATILAGLLCFGPGIAFAANSFDWIDPADGQTAGGIDADTHVINLIGGYTENGSDTLSNNISGLAGTATALAADGGNCSAGSFPLGVDASGAVQSCTDAATQAELNTHSGTAGDHHAKTINASELSAGELPDARLSANVTKLGFEIALGSETSGNYAGSSSEGGAATTATALAANGGNCSAGNYPLGVDASGAVESCTPVSGGGHTIATSTGTEGAPLDVATARTYITFGAGFTKTDDVGLDSTIINLPNATETITALSTFKGQTQSYGCVLTSLGHVYCTGNDASRQITANQSDVFLPQKINFDTSLKMEEIWTGAQTVFSRDSADNIWCWGESGSTYGECGHGGVTITSGPAQVPYISNVSKLVRAAGTGGGSGTCALEADGDLWCWGYNSYGAFGLGDTAHRTVPTLVTTGVKDVEMGGGQTGYMCIIDASDVMKCTGSNVGSNLGVGDTTQRTSLTTVLVIADPVVKMWLNPGYNSSSHHTFALTDDGKLYAWGHNGYGQLCNGDTTAQHTPQLIYGAGSGVTAMALSGGNSAGTVILKSGSVWVCGYGSYGQMGQGGTANSSTPLQPTGNPTAKKVFALGGDDATGSWNPCYIDNNDDVYCWGYNSAGRLGTWDTVDRKVPTKPLGIGGNIIDMAVAGPGTSAPKYALTSDGEVFAWGVGTSGELGYGGAQTRYSAVKFRLPR